MNQSQGLNIAVKWLNVISVAFKRIPVEFLGFSGGMKGASLIGIP